jgi:hypothetical protein
LKKILFLPIIAVLITVLSLLPQDAHASVSIDLKDQASCQALGGNWDASIPTCSIGALTLNSGDTLNVDNTVFSNIELDLYGTLTSNGTITNSGTIVSHVGISNAGTIYNYGPIVNQYGTLSNDGTIYNKASGTIINPNTSCSDTCIINNYGTIDNSGRIDVVEGSLGPLNNYATIINEASGIIEIRNTSTVTNSGTINNQGTISNEVESTINNSGKINNSGTINNSGPNGYASSTISNSGTITNLCGGVINNSGTMSGNPVVNACTTQTKTTLSINPISNVPWGKTITISGKLTNSSSGAGLAGKTVSFSGTGAVNLPNAVTDSNGFYSSTGAAPNTVTNGLTVQAHFAGDSQYQNTDSTVNTYNTLIHKTVFWSLNVPSSVTHGSKYSIDGKLKDTTTGLFLASKTVTFTATSPIVIPSTVTDSTGKYTASNLTAPAAGSYSIQAHFAGDSQYTSSDSPTKVLKVT